MAFIEQSKINEVREKANIVDIVGGYLPLTQKGKNFFGVCPFHDDHSPSMSVSSEKQIFKCFSCGASGNVFTFVSDYENVPFGESVSIVASKVGIIISNNFVSKKVNKNEEELKIIELANKYYQNNIKTQLGVTAIEYLAKRNIDSDAINEFGIGLSLKQIDGLSKLLLKKGYSKEKLYDLSLINQDNDLFINRIMFPLYDEFGNVVGFSGRSYDEEFGAKYVNSREGLLFKKTKLLYNYHLCKMVAKKEKQVIIVEGFMDAIRLSVNGIKNVVAIMGTSLTKDHVALLKKLRVKVLLCLDNDSAGKTATYTNGQLLEKSNIETEVIVLTGEKDPDDYITNKGIDAFISNMKNPIKFFDYKLEYLKHNKNLNNSNDLADYINDVIKSLENEKDEILIDITLQKLAKEYNVNIDLLKKRIKSTTKKSVKTTPVVNTPKRIKLHNKYDTAARRIIYYMMNSPTYIIMFSKKLGYINKYEYRMIINDILYYYEENKNINLADFITYISDRENMLLLIKSIVNECMDLELTDDEMLNYLQVMKEGNYLSEIEELKVKLKDELDHNKKIEIASRITKLKKGSVENVKGN